MSAIEMIKSEQEALRSELQFLKNCQVRYFILSIAASGAIIGLAEKLIENGVPQYVYLSPLLIIIPCWWIFFDKATTITRIVGYVRVLELIGLNKDVCKYEHLGWENSLSLFRKGRGKRNLLEFPPEYIKGIVKGFVFSLTLYEQQRYWALCWYTFCMLSITSVVLATKGTSENKIVLDACTWVVVFSGVHNLSVIGRLVSGPYSYAENFKAWKDQLTEEKVYKYLQENCPDNNTG